MLELTQAQQNNLNLKAYRARFLRLFCKLFSKIIGPLYVAICPGCERRVGRFGLFCPACWRELDFIIEPFCQIYGAPLNQAAKPPYLSLKAIAKPPPFNKLRAVFLHKGLTRRLVAQYKYSDKLYLTDIFAPLMLKAGAELLKESEIIIPIPLHYRRSWQRRYNQAAELARFIAERSAKLYLPHALIRQNYTRAQTKLSGQARADNVKKAFKLNSAMAAQLAGKNILLIDDVYTTGATIQGAIKALKKAKIGQINVLTLALADDN